MVRETSLACFLQARQSNCDAANPKAHTHMHTISAVDGLHRHCVGLRYRLRVAG